MKVVRIVPATRLARLAAAPALLVCAAASAETTSSSMNVSATVTANCTVSTSSVDFGSVNILSGSDVDGSGSITVTCTNGTSWTAAAGVGSVGGATLAGRLMSAGGNLLNYNLYTDSSRASIWGDGTGSTATIGGTGTGSGQTVTVYSRVDGGQSGVPVGSYSDTVAVTVAF